MAYGYFKDLPRRRTFDKVLRDKAFDIAKSRKYGGSQTGLASMVYIFFIKILHMMLLERRLWQNSN